MNIILLGPPGSGKGTQAELLEQKSGFFHLDVGSALRRIAGKKSALGRKVNSVINVKKQLVSNQLIEDVLGHELRQVAAPTSVVIDGAPRRIGQIAEVERALASTGRSIDAVVYLEMPTREIVRRITSRYICRKCDQPLILGKDIRSAGSYCPKCGGGVYRRNDDTPAGALVRARVFLKETLPVIREFRRRGKLITIDATQPIARVFQTVQRSIKFSHGHTGKK